jgi:phosphoribosylaminoimidazole (AIR) synthetase
LGWDAPCPFDVPEPGTTLGAALLCPTRLYVKPLLPLIKQGLTKGMAHITGGGLTDNIPRVLPANITASLDFTRSGFQLPPVFQWLQKFANLPQSELLRTFNCGIGMVVVVEESRSSQALALLRQVIPDAFEVGVLRERESPDSPQVVVRGELK